MKVGLVGYGKMGQIREKIINESKNFDLVAILEKNNKVFKCDKKYHLCKNYDELLRMDIDAVFLCTYVKYFSEYTIKALKSNKHVFCEKPPTMTLSEMKDVIKEEKKSGKILKYGFNHRFHYSVMEAKKIIKSGDLGHLLWFRGVYGKAGSIDYNENWRNHKKYSGGGIFIDQGIHMIDLIRFLSEKEFLAQYSYLSRSYWKNETEDNANIFLKSKDGIFANVHSSANQWKHKFLLEICLEDGFIILDGLLSSTRSYTPEKLIISKREFEDITFAMGKPKEQITFFENDQSWELELEEFNTCIKNNSAVINGNSKDSLELMKIVNEVYKNPINEKFNQK